MYCSGARLEAQYPVSAIMDGVGLNITLLSYRDRLDIGVVACRGMLDDAWDLVERLQASHAELLAAAIPPVPADAAERARRRPLAVAAN